MSDTYCPRSAWCCTPSYSTAVRYAGNHRSPCTATSPIAMAPFGSGGGSPAMRQDRTSDSRMERAPPNEGPEDPRGLGRPVTPGFGRDQGSQQVRVDVSAVEEPVAHADRV